MSDTTNEHMTIVERIASECVLQEDLDFGNLLGDIVIPRLLNGQNIIIWKDSVAVLTYDHYGCYGIDWLQYMGERIIDPNTGNQGVWDGLFIQNDDDLECLAGYLGYVSVEDEIDYFLDNDETPKQYWEYLDDASPEEMFGALYEYWSDGDGQRQHKTIRTVEDNRGW